MSPDPTARPHLPEAPPAPAAPPVAPPPVAPRRRAYRRAAWRLVALAAIVLVGLLGDQTVRGLRETLDRADRAAVASEAALRRVPLLTEGELASLRRSLNARHVELAERLGVAPLDSLGVAATGLVRADTLASVRVLDGTYSDPLLTPCGLAALRLVGDTLAAAARRAGVPVVRPVATSLLRSAASQAALRRVNANAAAGRSSHEFGTTFDLSYRRYEPLPPTGLAVSERVPRPLRSAVRQAAAARTARTHAHLVADYTSRYDALLGRALIRLEDAGAVVALRERNQTVYHVTAAR
ncbi:MAG TPA: DUF5715 family protein [Rubricoccaceae bacterium]|jgi:hypothetical protein